MRGVKALIAKWTLQHVAANVYNFYKLFTSKTELRLAIIPTFKVYPAYVRCDAFLTRVTDGPGSGCV